MTLTLCVRILRDMRRGYIELILSYVMLCYVENKLLSYLPACFPRPNNPHVPSIINGCHVLIGQENFFVMLVLIVMFVMLYLMRTQYFILTKPQSGLQGHS